MLIKIREIFMKRSLPVILTVIFGIAVFLFIITFSIGLPIYCRFFYYMQIEPLGIPEATGHSVAQIKAAYNQVLDYLTLPNKEFGAGVFAFNVDVKNPFIPNGALLFSSTEVRPRHGSLVICLDKNDNIRIGQYQIIADKYSIDFSTERVGGLVTKIHEKIKWIFPVLYYEVVTF